VMRSLSLRLDAATEGPSIMDKGSSRDNNDNTDKKEAA